jgi:2,3-bisphosphoglycerate-independent phosphoglycerate mutase
MHILLLFLDGVGLGVADGERNPFARARLPRLEALAGGPLLENGPAPRESAQATLFPTDANLGVDGRPQSATGQAVILTGRNVPQDLGEHWGPKPDARVRAVLEQDNLFMQVTARGQSAALLNAYPEAYFKAHESGRRLYSSVPLAARAAGLRLFTTDDLRAGRAAAADFTGAGWRTQLGYTDTPVFDAPAAGRELARLARTHTFSFFDCWIPDVLGHRREMQPAVQWLEEFDTVLGGLLDDWDHAHDLLIITSDHGNLEDFTARGHTRNLVPTILAGEPRRRLDAPIRALTGVAPAVMALLDR